MSSRIYTLMLFTPLVEICILNDNSLYESLSVKSKQRAAMYDINNTAFEKYP